MRFGRAVRDTERLDLLYALTVGDSRATGPAAWSSAEGRARAAALRRDRHLARARRGGPDGSAGRAHVPSLDAPPRAARRRRARRRVGRRATDGLLECTVVAARPHRLARRPSPGCSRSSGFDIRAPRVFGDPDGHGARGVPRRRPVRAPRRPPVGATSSPTLPRRVAGELAAARTARRADSPRTAGRAPTRRASMCSSTSTRRARRRSSRSRRPTRSGCSRASPRCSPISSFDVTAALVSTLGDRVVDVFYVPRRARRQAHRPLLLERLRATLSPGSPPSTCCRPR